MAKAYDVLSKRYPTELRDSTRFAKKATFQFEKFQMDLLEVIRFNHEDTLVFKLLLRNDTDEEILYDKFSFSVQAGNRTYYMSAADATGVMPPKSSTYAFFTITGTPEGRRNNLAADNEFRIGVTAQYMEQQAAVPESQTTEQKKETEEKIRTAEAEYDKRLAVLIANMEKTLAKIEDREAPGSLESAAAESADDDPVRETEVETGEEDTSETDAGSDVVWWDFSEFPGNLAFLINWMKF